MILRRHGAKARKRAWQRQFLPDAAIDLTQRILIYRRKRAAAIHGAMMKELRRVPAGIPGAGKNRRLLTTYTQCYCFMLERATCLVCRQQGHLRRI